MDFFLSLLSFSTDAGFDPLYLSNYLDQDYAAQGELKSTLLLLPSLSEVLDMFDTATSLPWSMVAFVDAHMGPSFYSQHF